MHVSKETIYQWLYIQASGELKRELTMYLSTGSSRRKKRRRQGEPHRWIPDIVMITERSPEVEDRAVRGHCEGELIMGSTA